MYIERTIVLLILAISLVSSANAMPNIVDLRQYKVFFDFEQRDENYIANIFQPSYSETLSGASQTSHKVSLENLTSRDTLTISIATVEKPSISFAAPVIFTTDTLSLRSIMDLVPKGFAYICSDRRVIDGSLGVVIEVKNLNDRKTGYFAQYRLPGESDAIITVLSYWPWYPDTLKLLDTIHVEKVA